MFNVKKLISVLSGSLIAAVIAVSVSAESLSNYYGSVAYNNNSDKYNSGSDYSIQVFYDYGTSAPFDNARIFSRVTSTQKTNMTATIHYANYGSAAFTTKNAEPIVNGTGEAYINYNPANVDYLQPTSYAKATYGSVIYSLTVTN